MPRKPNESRSAILRSKLGLTQPEWAKLCGVSAAAIASIESGRLKLSPRLQAVMEITATGRVDFEELIHERVAAYEAKLRIALNKTNAPCKFFSATEATKKEMDAANVRHLVEKLALQARDDFFKQP